MFRSSIPPARNYLRLTRFPKSAQLSTMASKLTLQSTLPLPNSNLTIPRLGFGVYQSPAKKTEVSCTEAIKNGYRHIDTAQFYANEAEVGAAVRNSGLKRSEIYITTKILSAGGSVEKSYQKCVESVQKLDDGTGGQEGYVDLFLIHSPNAGAAAREEMWQALLRLHKEGKAKAIGVSNFGIGHIERLKGLGDVWPPHVNQIELHPWNQQREVVEYCHKTGIVVEAYSPLVRNYKANDETLVGIAKKYNKSTAQILIRYCLQKDWVPLPKSDTPSRIKENAEIYDFEISDEDMKALDDLDEGAAGAIVQAVDNS